MTSVLDHTSYDTFSVRRRIGAASAAVALLAATGLLLDQSGSAQGATAIGLGTANGFAVLAGSGITNTGTTVITGDIGTFPTTTVTGDNAGQVDDIVLNGAHQDSTVTAAAKTGLLTAYNNAAGQASTQAITADLANPTATLSPGVYTSSSSMGLTGALTLDGGGNADAVFVFQAGSSLTTASASSIQLVGGAQACNVFWQVGSSATLGTDTVFVGNILAQTSITLDARASVAGRVLASGGAVTMENNVITRPVCITPTAPPAPSTGTPTPGTPTPTQAPGVDDPAGSTPGNGGTGTGPTGTGPTGTGPTGTGPTATSGRDSSVAGSGRQVARVPVGSVDAGDGSSARGFDTGE